MQGSPMLLIVTACLATTGLLVQGYEFDLKGLDNYVAKKHARSVSGVEMIEKIKQDINELDGATKDAANAIIDLLNVRECNERALSTIQQLQEAGFTAQTNPKTVLLLQSDLRYAFKACSGLIEYDVMNLAKSPYSDFRMKRLIQVLNPIHIGTHKLTIESLDTLMQPAINDGPVPRVLTRPQLADVLRDLAKSEEKNGKFNNDIKANLFQRYLLEPCKTFDSTKGHLFKAMRSVRQVYSAVDPNQRFASPSSRFNSVAWTHVACQNIISMSDSEKVLILNLL